MAIFRPVVLENFHVLAWISARSANQAKRPETFFSHWNEIFSALFEFCAEPLWLLRSGVKKKANVMEKRLNKGQWVSGAARAAPETQRRENFESATKFLAKKNAQKVDLNHWDVSPPWV